MNSKIKIRKIRKEEVGDFFKFFSRLMLTQFPEYSESSRKWLITHSKAFTKERISRDIKEGALWMGSYADGQLTGLIYGRQPWGGVSEIYWLAVDPSFQRKGIGALLLINFEKIVKSEGAHSIHLRTDQRNLAFYKKVGYEVIGFETKAYLGADDYVLRKIVQEPKEENFLK